ASRNSCCSRIHSFPTRRSSDLIVSLPIWMTSPRCSSGEPPGTAEGVSRRSLPPCWPVVPPLSCGGTNPAASRNSLASSAVTTRRSEEHTSELQSLAYLVCRLLL